MRPSERNRSPVEAEFFRPEGSAVAALVREAIQNSLDAVMSDGELVRVRFFVSGKRHALSRNAAVPWLRDLWPRLRASQIEDATTLENSRVPFLTVEDFGTRGLEGDPALAWKAGSREVDQRTDQEDFFYFWRSVGRTGKTGRTRGSWGLGKAVYPSASCIRTHFGLTIRASDQRQLLMGQSVLELHQLPGHGASQFAADGFFGDLNQIHGDDDFVSPAEDARSLARFRRDFGITRRNEPGLSLAIPFPDEEFTATDCGDRFAREVIENFFYPLLSGHLTVDIVTPEQTHRLHDGNIFEVLHEIEGRQPVSASVAPLIQLARWSLSNRAVSGVTVLNRSDGLRADWDELAIPPDRLPELRRQFNARQPVALRVPVLVRKAGVEPVPSHFSVCLQQKDVRVPGAFRFLRQGLTISGEAEGAAGGTIGLVIIDDEPLAQLLRDAEGPAHRHWICREERLKRNYIGGEARVRLVTSAPRQLVKRLMDTGADVDKDLLADLFPDPIPEGILPGGRLKRKARTDNRRSEPPQIPQKPRTIDINKINGGFTICRNESTPLASPRLVLLMAYDCIGADPFKAWEPWDFSLEKKRFRMDVDGGEIEMRQGNRLQVHIRSDTFRLRVTGFSLVRDLIVRHHWLSGEAEEAE